jgi:hypothetical protein
MPEAKKTSLSPALRSGMLRSSARLIAALGIGVLVAVATLAVPVVAQPESGGQGFDHDRLDALIGDWVTAIKHWDTPESEPVALQGRTTRKWLLGRRFVEERSENQTSRGGRFRSIVYLGFDRQAELYERFWMTNTATRIFVERGRYNPDDNLFRFVGTETGPSGVAISTTSELKILSPEQHVFTAYVTGSSGIRWKQLEIVYGKQ